MLIFSIEEINFAKLLFYQPIIPRDVYEEMNNISDESIIIGAKFNGEPVGIAIAKVQSSKIFAELDYLYVRSKFRRFGIGASLLRSLERVLVEKDCKKLYSKYLYYKHSRDIEDFFFSCGFHSPAPCMFYYQTNITKNEHNAPFFQRGEMPDGFSIFLWSDLTETERRTILDGENNWYPDYLSPFKAESKIEYKTSLGLRFQGEVIGWMITSITTQQELEYAVLFIKEEFQKLGVGITLVIKTVEMQQRELTEIPKAYFQVSGNNQNMLTITEQKIGRYLELEKKELRRVTKQLMK